MRLVSALASTRLVTALGASISATRATTGAPVVGLLLLAIASTSIAAAVSTTLLRISTFATTATTAAVATLATTTVSSTAAVSAAAEATTATSSTTTGTVGGFVDTDLTTVEFDVVHVLNGIVSLVFGLEADEAKATATASVAILNNDSFFNDTELLEFGAKDGVVGVPGQAADEQLGHDELFWLYVLVNNVRLVAELVRALPSEMRKR